MSDVDESVPAEWTQFAAAETGRATTQYTGAPASNYPLYYFVPSITDDQRWMVFHSERTGSVQLFRMDMADGSIRQLTHGWTEEAGWAIWCEPHLNGIFNHLSALNPHNGDVYYFDHDDIRAVDLHSLENRTVATIPGRIPIGQSHFSPDGSLFAFIDADREAFADALARHEVLTGPGAHDEWRNTIPTTIKVVETATGVIRTVVALDYHVHHVLFVDDETLLVNHSRGSNGMWLIGVDGTGERELRPGDERGQVCHQVVTDSGLLYETNHGFYEHAGHSWFGRYSIADDSYIEWQLPVLGYVHTGRDPAGEAFFIEAAGEHHGIYHVIPRPDSREADVVLLYRLNEHGHNDLYDQQRYHAHPWLGPDRRRLFFTDVIDGHSQILSIDVSDITGA